MRRPDLRIRVLARRFVRGAGSDETAGRPGRVPAPALAAGANGVDGRPSTFTVRGMSIPPAKRRSAVAKRGLPAWRLAPLARRTIGDEVVDTLRRSILDGTLAAGDHMAEGVVARQLGVSRAPVREAMMQLEREGLLVFDRRGAARVKAFTEGDFEEIFSLRLELETMAARLASRRLSEADAAGLREIIGRTGVAAGLLELALLDVEFHDRVVRAARHGRLATCWATLRHQLEYWLVRMQGRLEAPLARTRLATVRHHRQLLAALRSGREARAIQAFRAHIEGWRRQQAGRP